MRVMHWEKRKRRLEDGVGFVFITHCGESFRPSRKRDSQTKKWTIPRALLGMAYQDCSPCQEAL